MEDKIDRENIKKNKFWAGVILYNPVIKEVLLQKRDAEAPVNPNKWAFFGGTGEYGETPENCLVRELKEEIGVDLPQGGFTPMRDYLNEKLMIWRYVYTMPFTLDKSQMTLGEGEDFDWIPFDKVLEYDLTDNTKLDLEFFLRKLEKI